MAPKPWQGRIFWATALGKSVCTPDSRHLCDLEPWSGSDLLDWALGHPHAPARARAGGPPARHGWAGPFTYRSPAPLHPPPVPRTPLAPPAARRRRKASCATPPTPLSPAPPSRRRAGWSGVATRGMTRRLRARPPSLPPPQSPPRPDARPSNSEDEPRPRGSNRASPE